jgi:hypothetical protein
VQQDAGVCRAIVQKWSFIMKIILATLAAAGLVVSTGAVFAQSNSPTGDTTFTGVDTNRDNAVSWPEFQLVFPDISEEAYNTADANSDGILSLEEYDSLALSTGSISQRPAVPSDAPMPNSLTYSPPQS